MRRIFGAGDVSLYEHSAEGPARVLVASTPTSRRLLTDPRVSGSRYRRSMRTAVTEALQVLVDADETGALPVGAVSVLNILRGGLCFGVEDAVADVLGAEPSVSFVGTSRSADGTVEPSYERWDLESPVRLVIGDILSTGGTLTSVLAGTLAAAEERGGRIESVLIFTVGSRLGTQRLQEFLAGLGAAERPETTVVAMEALFDVPAPGSTALFNRYPFDLLRSPVGSAPEFELRRLQTLDSVFERCVVYDGGIRAFAPAEHARQRREWWADVVRRGVSLTELAHLVAGLGTYRRPFEDWRQTFAWYDQADVDFAAVHDLGRRALRHAEDTATADYARAVLGERPR